MKNPPEDVLKAMLALKQSPHWQRIVEWIQQSYDQAVDVGNTTKEEIEYRWNQGKAQELKQILSYIQTAFERHESIRTSQQMAAQAVIE